MSETTTPSAADRPDQPTTAADVASEVIQSVDAADFKAYSGQTRQSILALLERLVQADQGARLASLSGNIASTNAEGPRLGNSAGSPVVHVNAPTAAMSTPVWMLVPTRSSIRISPMRFDRIALPMVPTAVLGVSEY